MTLALLHDLTLKGAPSPERVDLAVLGRRPTSLPVRCAARFFVAMPATASEKEREWMRNGRVRPHLSAAAFLTPVLRALVGTVAVDEACVVESYGDVWYAEEPRTELRLFVHVDNRAH